MYNLILIVGHREGSCSYKVSSHREEVIGVPRFLVILGFIPLLTTLILLYTSCLVVSSYLALIIAPGFVKSPLSTDSVKPFTPL